MKTSIVIFGMDQEIAEKIMSDFFFTMNEPITRRTIDSYETDTKIVRARKWILGQRGIRAHELYIDRRIDAEVIEECIVPCLRQKIQSWEQTLNEHDKWNWRDHVRYF